MKGWVTRVEEGGRIGCPRLASFPMGAPPNCEDMRLEVGQKTTKGKKRRRTVVSSVDGLAFKGCDYGEYDGGKNLVTFAIACVDEASRCVRILPADHAFIMRPDLSESHKSSAPPRLSSLTPMERRDLRTDEFGSRKKKRAAQVAASNIISAENISGASAVQSAMERSLEEEGERVNETDVALDRNRKMYLPAFNAGATEAEDIYPLTSLLPESLEDAIDACVDRLLEEGQAASEEEEEVVEDEGMPAGRGHQASPSVKATHLHLALQRDQAAECVLRSLQNLRAQLEAKLLKVSKAYKSDRAAKTAKRLFKKGARLSLLLHFMIRFHNAVMEKVASHTKQSQAQVSAAIRAPDAVAAYFYDTFASPKRFVVLSKLEKERLKTHMIAALLHISEFAADLSLLSSDLKLQEKKLFDLARQMGCVVAKKKENGTTMSVASLCVPLTFPPPKINKAKAKKA